MAELLGMPAEHGKTSSSGTRQRPVLGLGRQLRRARGEKQREGKSKQERERGGHQGGGLIPWRRHVGVEDPSTELGNGRSAT
jgi:hypothetical protein